MINQIMSFQAALNLFGVGLAVDGKAGPMTYDASRLVTRNLPDLADLPRDPSGDRKSTTADARLVAGRASTFGGKNDPGDYCEHQAYLPLPVDRTPAQYYAWVEPWVRALLVPEMADAQVWPMVRDWQGKTRRAGVSYYLDPRAPYVALRLYGELAKQGKRGEPVRVRVYSRADRSRWVDCIVSDWGPAEVLDGKRWRFDVDLSPGVYEALGLQGRRGRDGYYLDHVWVEVLP